MGQNKRNLAFLLRLKYYSYKNFVPGIMISVLIAWKNSFLQKERSQFIFECQAKTPTFEMEIKAFLLR